MSWCRIHTQKTIAFVYITSNHLLFEMVECSIHKNHKLITHLGINLTRKTHNLYEQRQKASLKDEEKGHPRWPSGWTWYFQCRGLGLIPYQGTRSLTRELDPSCHNLRVHRLQHRLRIFVAAAETQHSQLNNKQTFKRMKKRME